MRTTVAEGADEKPSATGMARKTFLSTLLFACTGQEVSFTAQYTLIDILNIQK
jgi:hypothetical protein